MHPIPSQAATETGLQENLGVPQSAHAVATLGITLLNILEASLCPAESGNQQSAPHLVSLLKEVQNKDIILQNLINHIDKVEYKDKHLQLDILVGSLGGRLLKALDNDMRIYGSVRLVINSLKQCGDELKSLKLSMTPENIHQQNALSTLLTRFDDLHAGFRKLESQLDIDGHRDELNQIYYLMNQIPPRMDSFQNLKKLADESIKVTHKMFKIDCEYNLSKENGSACATDISHILSCYRTIFEQIRKSSDSAENKPGSESHNMSHFISAILSDIQSEDLRKRLLKSLKSWVD